MAGGNVPLASRMPVSMASFACSDSLKAFRKRSSYPGQTETYKKCLCYTGFKQNERQGKALM